MLEINERRVRGIVILDLSGFIFDSEAMELVRTVRAIAFPEGYIQAGRTGRKLKLLLNMDSIMEVDSNAAGALFALFMDLGGLGGQIRVLKPPSELLQLLTVTTELASLIPAFDDEQSAIASFRS